VRNDLSSQLVSAHSNSVCETFVVKVKTLNILLICVYRPPDCKLDKFEEALNVCQDARNKTMKEDTKVRNVLEFVDYNFPFISWPSRKISKCQQGREVKRDKKKQAELLCNMLMKT
jgi:hypothetical protein